MAGGAPAPALRVPDAAWQKVQRLELLVFLLLIVPSTVLSFFVIPHANLGFVITAWATIAHDVALVGLIAFFVWRNGEPAGAIGWRVGGSSREVAIGAAAFVPMLYGMSLFERGFRQLGFSAPTRTPRFLTASGPDDVVLALVLVAVVAVAEETAYRGYLIRRLASVSGSPTLAVLLSAFIFSLGHSYEGTAGVATVGVTGVVLALVYLWRGSLVAPVVMHFLQDFTGIVLVSVLGHRG
jgi:membrane protease YdiL (CAAX protease family)